MGTVNETSLPGVGIRFDFTTREGDRVVVVNHRSGRSELLVCSKQDPDACHEVLRLAKEDARSLAEILGQSQVTEEVTSMRLSTQGLTIDWLPTHAESRCVGRSVYDIEHLDQHAATIVAVVRGETTIPAPPSVFTLQPGDVAVVVGTPEGVEAMATLLRSV
ncbi:MAG: TrkA C-terminal domain-containing protein [Thermoleophilia bacterium]